MGLCSFRNEPVCLEVTFLYLFRLLVALIKYIRPVFVSRSDQDSRKKTVEEIKRRAHSGGEWPQVNGRTLWMETLKTLSICVELIRPGCLKWQRNEISGETREALVDANRPVITLQESWSFPGSAVDHTRVNNFSKVIPCRACALSRIQPTVHVVSVGEGWPVRPFFFSFWDLALLIFVLFSDHWAPFFPLLFRSWFFPRERAPTDPV